MITITIYGLDQFVVGRLSREMTPNLAKLYELSEDEILFVAPENMVFHNGVEQTSWNIIIHVHAPKKVAVLQDQVAHLILESIGDVAINKILEFYYYSQDDRYSKFNDKIWKKAKVKTKSLPVISSVISTRTKRHQERSL